MSNEDLRFKLKTRAIGFHNEELTKLAIEVVSKCTREEMELLDRAGDRDFIGQLHLLNKKQIAENRVVEVASQALGQPQVGAMSGKSTVAAELVKRLASRRYAHEPAPSEPVPRFFIADIPICTPGNLTTISAQAKAGKSAVVGGMLASTFAEPGTDCLGFRSDNPNGWAVVHLDTEQCPFDHWEGIERTVKRARTKLAPKWLVSHCVTGFTSLEIRASIKILLEQAKAEFGGIHSVVIDGIADGANDVNDIEECQAFVAELHSLAIEHHTPIINIIHLNPGSTEKTRGHLGSQLERKSETNLRLEKDQEEVTVIWADKNRRAPISKRSGPRFCWSDDLKMHVSLQLAQLTSGVVAGHEDTTGKHAAEIEGLLEDGKVYTSPVLKALISKHLHCSERTASTVLSRVVLEGRLVPAKRGSYECITEEERDKRREEKFNNLKF